MKRTRQTMTIALLLTASLSYAAQPSAASPSTEVRRWDIFAGDWALSGTAKDSPTATAYKVDWSLHEHWILGGFFMQVDQTWRANHHESHSLEILSYDPIRKVHASSGYSDDGSTWSLTAIFRGTTVVEDGASNSSKGPTKCRTTWVFSPDRKSLSGTQECDANGQRWTTFRVQGTKLSH